MAHGHLCPSLLGLVAPRTQGSNCALTPYGESGLAFGFGSFVGYRIVVGKHIFPTPICCSVGSGVAAATSRPSWGLSLSWTAVRYNTLSAACFAASRRGAIRAVARPSRAPLPYPASVTRGPGRPPSLRFAPAVVVGGKGVRCLGGKPPGFFFGCRLGAFMRLWRLDAACVRAVGKNPLRTLRGILPPARPLRSPFGRPQPHFCPKAHALLARRGRGPFKLTGLARQPCNNLKLSPRPHRPKTAHRAFVIRQKLGKNEPVRRERISIRGHSLPCPL